MSPRPVRKRLAVPAVLAALAVGAGAWALSGGVRDKPELGLMSTLPIYWGEAGDVGEMLSDAAQPHWVRNALEQDYRLVPLDTLDAGEGGGLAALDLLLLAQPRALSPAENVALDGWVRGGGHVLLFADPFLTGESRFHIGDRRRPQDVVLLSPILRRWGLDLRFDSAQPDGERTVEMDGAQVPVNLAGTFMPQASDAPSDCRIEAEGLLADCRIGKGRALILADAAVLDTGRGQSEPALDALAQRAFQP